LFGQLFCCQNVVKLIPDNILTTNAKVFNPVFARKTA
jgi:hypothetical protein